jgi:4-alpha-glucanotransferase
VSASSISEFVAANSFWISDWGRLAGGRRAVADQVRFDREWGALRRYCASLGIRLLGDVAIYVAPGSVDHRAHPELFRSGVVAGAPPDAFSDEGQLWGNPLYDWPALRREGYRWWIERFRRTFELFDLARVDHFRGFVSYWAVPAGAATARHGRWRRGPGGALFRAAEAELGELPLIAEDLGSITPAVTRLRRELGMPGMHVLQWAFAGWGNNPHRIENHEKNGVVTTGTHDMDTAVGWWNSLSERQRRATGLDPNEPHWSLIELGLSSRARLAIFPAQDVLGLGSDYRMNLPGTVGGNWRWRLEPGALTPELARRLREATEASGR